MFWAPFLLALSTIPRFLHAKAVNVFVMLPLDTVVEDGGYGNLRLKDGYWLQQQMHNLKNAGVHGIMSDCWWGLVEKKGPKQYNFKPYIEMTHMAQKAGLKVQMVMSFHQCGTNVGDECLIPLPSWLNQQDVYYKTRSGLITTEYISLWADYEPMDSLNRTPLEMYRDFMKEFKKQVVDAYPETVIEVQIGAGPSGELRYPSYQLQDKRWDYCGVGEFTSYDKYALQSLKANATYYQKDYWALSGGPSNAGNFKCKPPNDQCSFYSSGYENFASDYGKFYLTWYSNSLIQHGKELSTIARQIYGPNFDLSMKVAGIHWYYNSDHHGAELNAGYYNTEYNNGYKVIAESFKNSKIIFCFTCLEMFDADDNDQCKSKPEALVRQTKNAVRSSLGSLENYYAGENALPVHGQYSINQIITQAKGTKSFTWLRLTRNTDYKLLRYLVEKLQ